MTDIFDPDYGREVDIEISENLVVKGDAVNLRELDPALTKLVVALGWQATTYASHDLDLDVSCFLLNKDDKTRKDSDFIFYNNLHDDDQSVVHEGDNLTGAGDGDDETILIDLNKIPFDISRVMFVLTIYKGEERGQTMDSLKNAYIRLLHGESKEELLRYKLDDEASERSETGMYVASLDRDGPMWLFRAIGEFEQGGLADIATKYDLIIHRS